MLNKVSIIMPAYNSAEYISEAISSVINQTYTNWELIVVDDCSTDNTQNVIMSFAQKDNRILYYVNEKNSGAAASRNKAVKVSTGKYLAFLDSDDKWFNMKLEKQIKFMEENNYLFTCTSYNKIDEKSEDIGQIVKALNVDYEGLLKRCPGNSTIIYNVEVLGKHIIPLIKKRNDYVMWLQVIKHSKQLYGLNEILSSHRVGMITLSSNKKSLIKYHWFVYKKIEKLSTIKSVYLILFWILKSLLKI